MKVILNKADNGLIKVVVDENMNGAGERFESKEVYDFSEDDYHQEKIKFFYKLAEDLGINIGNAYEHNNLTMDVDWGLSYQPSIEELKFKMDYHKNMMNVYKSSLKNIEDAQ